LSGRSNGKNKAKPDVCVAWLAFLSILWLLLWCFDWLAIISAKGDSAEMFIKHTADLHLFGVGFSMAGYASGWLATRLGNGRPGF
jgi:hypothetical protein